MKFRCLDGGLLKIFTLDDLTVVPMQSTDAQITQATVGPIRFQLVRSLPCEPCGHFQPDSDVVRAILKTRRPIRDGMFSPTLSYRSFKIIPITLAG